MRRSATYHIVIKYLEIGDVLNTTAKVSILSIFSGDKKTCGHWTGYVDRVLPFEGI